MKNVRVPGRLKTAAKNMGLHKCLPSQSMRKDVDRSPRGWTHENPILHRSQRDRPFALNEGGTCAGVCFVILFSGDLFGDASNAFLNTGEGQTRWRPLLGSLRAIWVKRRSGGVLSQFSVTILRRGTPCGGHTYSRWRATMHIIPSNSISASLSSLVVQSEWLSVGRPEVSSSRTRFLSVGGIEGKWWDAFGCL